MNGVVIFFAVIVFLIVLLAIMNRPMVSDGKGGLIPKSQYDRNRIDKLASERFLIAPENGKASRGRSETFKTENTDNLWAEKDLVRNIRAGNLKDAETSWGEIERRYDNDNWKIAVWSVSFDEAHPHPENDFFWDGIG